MSTNYDVVIIGAGPSGLALAIELGSRGVRCLLSERNDRVGYAPRAKTTNVRTRTHLRRWGIADKLAAESPFGVDYPSTVNFVTRLGGFGLARIENASNCHPARNDLYPEHGQWVPQYKLEQVMREHAETLPTIELRFSTEFVSATQQPDGVDLLLRNRTSGEELPVRCGYVVGADGARSALRDVIGATMHGTYGLSRNYNIVFRAPGLAEAHGHGAATMYWQVNPAAPSLIGPMDRDDIWFFMPTRLPEGFKITSDTAATLIREATGIDLPYEILSSDEWVASSLIADRYRDGRIFLIGDACHLHPPFGGYGMNMGVADGVDLGWKLAAMVQGWGGPALLDSYEIERRVIHEEVIAEAAANHAVLSNDFWSDGLEEPGEVGDAMRRVVGERIAALKRREFHTLKTVLGGCYKTSPVLAIDDDIAPTPSEDRRYIPSSRVGCLAPHVWRADGRSLYDLFGKGFALVARFDAGSEQTNKALADAARRGIALAVIYITEHEAIGRYDVPLTLVRPDQHVAWRGRYWSDGVLDLVAGWSHAEVDAVGSRTHEPRVGTHNANV
ncbi:FAD-dependent monooxygenase [Sphingomonas sp. PAMC 26605]|uniref:FAD-dependent monooxygenase n=1 Tax=Sphingomonas sp. PAMC 26605 TaxID=1112214 RepID=UPI0002D90F6C|nr:FAD-dependent monooxygenase [Sphingomonas sp. PAMC 26605]